MLTELNNVNGLWAIAGFLFAGAGFLVDGVVQIVVIAIGLVILVPTFVNAVRRSIPPSLMTPERAEGKELVIADLAAIEPPVPGIGIIGPSRVGKTTLRDALLQRSSARQATQRITVHVSSIIKNPTTFLAVLDGRGEAYGQQFEVANAADILCVLIDHNSIDGQSTIGPGRLEKHVEFGDQVRSSLENEWIKRPRAVPLRVHLLLNKEDEWKLSALADQSALHAVLADEEAKWRALQGVGGVSTATHTNNTVESITKLAGAIKDHWTEIQKAKAIK
jgi:hypothetical protein